MAKLIVLFVTAFVDMVGLMMVVPLLPYYASSFGAGATTVGLLVSVFSLAQMACAPTWGRLSDRYGRRPVILAGLVITALAYLLFGLADSIVVLLVSRVIQGVGGGTIGVIQAYVADASPPEKRTRSLGWLTAVTSLGAVVGPAFGSVFVGLWGRRAPGFCAAALALLVAGFASRFLTETRARIDTAEWTALPVVSTKKLVAQIATGWNEIPSRLIWIYAVAIGAFYGTVPTMPLLLSDRFGITEASVGYVIMYLGAVGVVIRAFLLGRLLDRFGEKRLTRSGMGLLAGGLAVLAVASSYPALVFALTLMPLGTASLFPALSGQLSSAVRQSERGVYMGLQQAFGGASRVLFPIGVGLVMDHVGNGLPFFLAALLVLAALPLTVPPRERSIEVLVTLET